VYDSETKEYTGFLDMRDLARFVVYVHDQKEYDDNVQLAELIRKGGESGTDGPLCVKGTNL
jgi:hypothetical protein